MGPSQVGVRNVKSRTICLATKSGFGSSFWVQFWVQFLNWGPTFDNNVHSIIIQSLMSFDKRHKLRLSIILRSINLRSIIVRLIIVCGSVCVCERETVCVHVCVRACKCFFFVL